jgi:serine/threonine protein kinase
MNILILLLLFLVFKNSPCLANKRILSNHNEKKVTLFSSENNQFIELKYSKTSNEFHTELKALSNLKHENIISMISFNENEKIILEEAGCCSLYSFIRNPKYFFNKYKFSDTDNLNEIKLDIIKQIILGLKFIHKNGYVHLDIKPQNFVIFFENKIIVKFIDFSSCKKIQQNKIYQTGIIGTFEYLPPEIIDKALYRKTYKIRYSCDIYALALTINFILNGKSVGELADKIIYEDYKAETNEESERCFIDLIKHQNWRPFLNTNPIFESINDLTNTCWEKNYKERPTIKKIYKYINYTDF